MSLLLHPSDPDRLHLHPKVPTCPPASAEQTPNQHTDRDRHRTAVRAEGLHSALTVLCSLVPQGPKVPLRQTGLAGGCWGSCVHLGASPTKARKEAFQKEGAVLNAAVDLQACLGFSTASSCPHFKESFRSAAIRGPVMR